ncbi:hypothetical protein BD414DRAFT_474870 [Trametes punicea]|nr:hypothetical protein BD414DRAFT_474870 [Trametes punicea]
MSASLLIRLGPAVCLPNDPAATHYNRPPALSSAFIIPPAFRASEEPRVCGWPSEDDDDVLVTPLNYAEAGRACGGNSVGCEATSVSPSVQASDVTVPSTDEGRCDHELRRGRLEKNVPFLQVTSPVQEALTYALTNISPSPWNRKVDEFQGEPRLWRRPHRR